VRRSSTLSTGSLLRFFECAEPPLELLLLARLHHEFEGSKVRVQGLDAHRYDVGRQLAFQQTLAKVLVLRA
jgi:hypothetical protein